MATDKETIDTLRNEIEYLKSKNQQMMVMMRKSEDSMSPSSAGNAGNVGNAGSAGSVTPSVPSVTGPSSELDVSSNDILTKNVWRRRS